MKISKKKNTTKKKSVKKPMVKRKMLLSKKKKSVIALVKKTKKLNDSKKPTLKKLLVKKIAVKRKVAKKPIKKVQVQKSNESFLPESFFKAKIKVIGIGGGGGSIVSEMGKSLHKATFVVADTDMRSFKKRPGIKQFLFGQSLTHGLGTGVNPQLGRLAAESEKERIAQFFQNQDIVIFVASLGGGLGSGATQVFAEAVKNFDGITFGIFTLPFKFEGVNKYKIAMRALAGLRKSLNVSITIPNEKIFKIIDANTAITDAFSTVNKSLISSLESLIDLIYSPGIINIDFADLRTILKGKGNLAFLNTVVASGKNRAEEISQNILHNALYQTNNFEVEKILFNISGGGELSMLEVDKISRAIAHKNPKAKIIFGISKDSSLKNKIKTTLLMTGGGGVKPSLEPKKIIEPAKHPVKMQAKPAVKVKAVAKKTPKKTRVITAPQKQVIDQVPIALPTTVKVSQVSPVALVVDGKDENIMEAQIKPKKPIRRNALEIKKAQDTEESQQSLQEKEWEIPAFLRIKK